MNSSNSDIAMLSPHFRRGRTTSSEDIADGYANISTPTIQDPTPPSRPVSRTQKWLRSWVVTRWKLSRTVFSVPMPVLTAKFDIKRGDLVLTLPFLIVLLAASIVLTNDRNIKTSGAPPSLTMVLVFATAVRNNSFVLTLTGLPFERALLYHKIFAYASIILTVFHAYADKLAKDDGHVVEDDSKVFTGAVAFFGMVLMYLLSLNFIRRRYFEFFLRVHWILFIVVIVFSVIHGAVFIMVGVLPWLVDMLYRLVFHARTLSKGKKGKLGIVSRDQVSIHSLPGSIVRIQFPRVHHETGEVFEYEAGQYAFLCIPSLSLLEWHPFTISSAPHEELVTFHIKELGDWTAKLTAIARDTNDNSPFDVLLDGPYGSVSVDIENPSVYSHFVLLSGGIGVTPMRSIANWLYHQHLQGSRSDLKHVHFAWSVRDRELIESIVKRSSLELEGGCAESYFPHHIEDSASINDPMNIFFSEFFLTKGKQDAEALFDRKFGHCLRYAERPNIPEILRTAGQRAKGDGKERVAVLVCGPKAMVSSAVTSGIALSKEMGIHFDIHTELFDF